MVSNIIIMAERGLTEGNEPTLTTITTLELTLILSISLVISIDLVVLGIVSDVVKSSTKHRHHQDRDVKGDGEAVGSGQGTYNRTDQVTSLPAALRDVVVNVSSRLNLSISECVTTSDNWTAGDTSSRRRAITLRQALHNSLRRNVRHGGDLDGRDGSDADLWSGTDGVGDMGSAGVASGLLTIGGRSWDASWWVARWAVASWRTVVTSSLDVCVDAGGKKGREECGDEE